MQGLPLGPARATVLIDAPLLSFPQLFALLGAAAAVLLLALAGLLRRVRRGPPRPS